MGTHGFIGWVIDGQTKVTYNHFDSYPDCLGVAVLTWATVNAHVLTCPMCRDESGGPADLARRLRVIPADSVPTRDEQTSLARFANLGVSEQSLTDWYCLLRECQGDMGKTLEAGVIVDSSDFPAYSLFAEWGYVVDIDNGCLEVYKGFQTSPHAAGRFATMPIEAPEWSSTTYYPVALCAVWSLDSLPSADEFLASLAELGDE